jgi:protein-tyrosine-phosphatase
MPTILIVGAADTGRAPMAAALLRRHLESHNKRHSVASAGVLGHDGDPASDDAQHAIEQVNLDISDHVARSLDDELAASADLLVAIDSGTARVISARFPQAARRIDTLGALAGNARDIPDPFKMQIGAWLAYAREIDELLARALPRMLERLDNAAGATEAEHAADLPNAPIEASTQHATPTTSPATSTGTWRAEAVARMQQILGVLEQMPSMVDWVAARARMQHDLDGWLAPGAASDAAPALAGMLRAALSLSTRTPTRSQIAVLRDAVGLLEHPVTSDGLSSFSAVLARWNELD